MKRLLLLLAIAVVATPMIASAEEAAQEYKFDLYGFVRSDFYYDSRDNVTSCNDLFYLYPADIDLDSAGNDLNEVSSSSIYSFVTRLGLDITGPNVGRAKASGKIEIDFGGYGNTNTLLRIRQANLNLAWESGSSLLIGQTWHPFFGSVAPFMASLSTGSPFQPFNRSPQLRYQYSAKGWSFVFAALYQMQYTSSGPSGYSNEYQVHSTIPELCSVVEYSKGGFLVGGGVEMVSLTPRTQSDTGYKVSERMTTYSGEVHLKYQSPKLFIGAKSILASSLDHTLMLGGYGVSEVVNETTDERRYTPIRNTTSWINITYGKRWKPYMFVGYTKNLGSSEALYSASTSYGRGLDIDQLLGATIGLNYNRSNWMTSIEYNATTAWYGTLNLANGMVVDTHSVTNNRVSAIVSYFF